MAATYTILASAVTHSTAFKCYLQLFKDATSTLTVKVYRVYLINANIAAVTGVLPVISLSSISTASSAGAPSTITPIKHDTNSATITSGSGGFTINSGNTTTGTVVNTYRRLTYASDEYVVSGSKIENFYGLVPYSILWDSGYGDSAIEPLTLPASTAGGIMISSAGIASAAGNVDVVIEFTAE